MLAVRPALTYTGVGNCVVDANQAGSANYNAAPQVQKTITIGKGSQTITFTPPTTGAVGGGTTLSATGGGSGNPVTFTIDATVDGRGVHAVRLGPHLHRVGNCVVDANQAGNANYNAAPQVQQTITVGKGSPDHHLHPADQGSVGGGTTLSATGGASGNPVTFTIDGTVHRRGLLAVRLGPHLHRRGQLRRRRQPGRQRQLQRRPPGPADHHRGQGQPRPSPSPRRPAASVGGGTTLSATGGASGNPVTFTIDGTSTAGACSLSGSALTYTGVGNCVVDANQAGNANYNAAPQVQQTITVGKGSPDHHAVDPAHQRGGGQPDLHAHRHRRRVRQSGGRDRRSAVRGLHTCPVGW